MIDRIDIVPGEKPGQFVYELYGDAEAILALTAAQKRTVPERDSRAGTAAMVAGVGNQRYLQLSQAWL